VSESLCGEREREREREKERKKEKERKMGKEVNCHQFPITIMLIA